MSQSLLDYLGMDTLAKHQRCVGMAGIVKAVTLEAGETHYFFEGTTEPPRKDRGAISVVSTESEERIQGGVRYRYWPSSDTAAHDRFLETLRRVESLQ